MITTIKELSKSNIQLPAWFCLYGRWYHVIDIKFCGEEILLFYDKTSNSKEQDYLDYVQNNIDNTRISISENINEEEEKELQSLIDEDTNVIINMINELHEKIEALDFDKRNEVVKYYRNNILSEIESDRNLERYHVIKKTVRIMKMSRLNLETENYGNLTVNLSHISQYTYYKGLRNITLVNGLSLIVPVNQNNAISINVLDALYPKID